MDTSSVPTQRSRWSFSLKRISWHVWNRCIVTLWREDFRNSKVRMLYLQVLLKWFPSYLYDLHVEATKSLKDVVTWTYSLKYIEYTILVHHLLVNILDLKVSSCLEDMSGSDFLILHHEIDWGPPEKIKTRKEIINEHFSSIRTWVTLLIKLLQFVRNNFKHKYFLHRINR